MAAWQLALATLFTTTQDLGWAPGDGCWRGKEGIYLLLCVFWRRARERAGAPPEWRLSGVGAAVTAGIGSESEHEYSTDPLSSKSRHSGSEAGALARCQQGGV